MSLSSHDRLLRPLHHRPPDRDDDQEKQNKTHHKNVCVCLSDMQCRAHYQVACHLFIALTKILTTLLQLLGFSFYLTFWRIARNSGFNMHSYKRNHAMRQTKFVFSLNISIKANLATDDKPIFDYTIVPDSKIFVCTTHKTCTIACANKLKTT